MQSSDVKIEHRESGRLDEMSNTEKAECLHFGGLQAESAGFKDGSFGFLASGFTSGFCQASAKV